MENGYSSGNSASSADLKHGSEEPSKPASGKAGGAMAAIIQQAKTRKRKGSLRKTALLGTGKVTTPVIHNTPPSPASPVRSSRAPYESSSPTSSSENLTFKLTPRVPVPGSQSTTDDDDPLMLPSQSPIAQSPGTSFSKNSTPTDAYFPPISPRHLRPPLSRPSKSTSRSPLASLPPSFPLPTPSEHSYAETAYWGWFILFVTWIVFVVGMGSCFEVWSWAWDVGETPYAPPELEDDPTLPIVGYYPCLIILTGVMAWVWVVVAWVGMKYFKHAKMGGDEG